MKKLLLSLLLAAMTMTVFAAGEIKIGGVSLTKEVIEAGIVDSLAKNENITEVSGTITYDTVNYVLTFDNVYLKTTLIEIITFNPNSNGITFTLNLVGENTIETSAYMNGVGIQMPYYQNPILVIDGNKTGILNIKGNYLMAYALQTTGGNKITLKNANVNALAGSVGANGFSGELVVDNSNLTIYSEQGHALGGLQALTFIDSYLAGPEGSYINDFWGQNEGCYGVERPTDKYDQPIVIKRKPVTGDTLVIDGVKYLVRNPATQVEVIKQDYTGSTLVIPDSVTCAEWKYGVVQIVADAFKSNENLLSIDIACPTINVCAFESCPNLETVTLREGVTSIFQRALASLPKLDSIHIPASINRLDAGWYNNTMSPFNRNSLRIITVAEANQRYVIGDDGALYTKDGTKLIAFPRKSDKRVGVIPEGVEEIVPEAFYDCPMADTVVLPSTLIHSQRIMASEGAKCVIINNVGTSCSSCFYYSDNLQEIILGPKCKYLPNLMFYKSFNVRKITILSDTIPEWQYAEGTYGSAFGGYGTSTNNPYTKAKVYVRCGMGDTFRANTGKWANFANIIDTLLYDINIVSDHGTVVIGGTTNCNQVEITATPESGYVFNGWANDPTKTEATASFTIVSDTTITALYRKIPAQGDTIRYAYKGNNLYYLVTVKNQLYATVSIVNDGNTEWAEANKPTGTLVIPDSVADWLGTKYAVTGLYGFCFRGCKGITAVDYSENTHITNTGWGAFKECYGITRITLSEYITDIADYCFEGDQLTDIDLKNVETIGMANFSCKNVHIPASMGYIDGQSDLFLSATTITCDENNQSYCASDNMLFSKDKKTLVSLPGGRKEGAIRIPASVDAFAYGAMRGFEATVIIDHVIAYAHNSWVNSPNGRVILGCGLRNYYAVENAESFQYAKEIVDSLVWSIEAIAGANGSVAIMDTTDCNLVRIQATPDEHYVFDRWSNGVTTAEITLNVASDTAVTALFKKERYKIAFYPTAEDADAETNKLKGTTADYLTDASGLAAQAQALLEIPECGKFMGWTKDGSETYDVTSLTEAAKLYPIWQIPGYFTIVFKNSANGEVIATETDIECGDDAITPVSEVAGHHWIWASNNYENVHADAVIFGTLIDDNATGIEGVHSTEYRVQKVIRDGQLYLMHNGKIYNIMGAKVK